MSIARQNRARRVLGDTASSAHLAVAISAALHKHHGVDAFVYAAFDIFDMNFLVDVRARAIDRRRASERELPLCVKQGMARCTAAMPSCSSLGKESGIFWVSACLSTKCIMFVSAPANYIRTV